MKFINLVIRKFRGLRPAQRSFAFAVIFPTMIVSFYYAVIASDQYRSEALFAVRGTTTSPLSALGLAMLPGANVQSGDSYIVVDYIRSKQLLIDAAQIEKIDMRSFFSDEKADFYFRVDPQISLDEFVKYWTSLTEVEFNSTTGIITFAVRAFSAKDAHRISQAVVKVSEGLVNRLSDTARRQLIRTAQDEVQRTEMRLEQARQDVEDFRNKEQALDPQLVAQSEQAVIKELQTVLASVQARRSALAETSKDSPTLRVLDRQISAIENQIADQRKRVGSGDGRHTASGNLSSIYTKYSALLLQQNFAEKAYTAAQTALEQALIEARKQERYFAIVVDPTLPEAALFPRKIVNLILIFSILTFCWLIFFLVRQSINDHDI